MNPPEPFEIDDDPGLAQTSESPELGVPSLQGHHVYLRPMTPADYTFVHQAETTGEVGPRWRFRGSTPSPERWAQETWAQCLALFLVISRRTETPLGSVAIHRANFQDRHARLYVTRFGLEKRSPALILGVALFVDYVFSCWDFRKLYMDVPEYNYADFASGAGRYFEMEGRLREDIYAGGRHWDQIILAIYREKWREHGAAAARFEAEQ